MYAIAFDLHQDTLCKTYSTATYTNAYNDIKKVLNSYNFTRQQGSVYFGDEKVDPVDCVMAIQELTNLYPWFSASVQDIRMLRIEENNDLRKIIDKELSKNN